MWPGWMLEWDVSQWTLDSLFKKNILSPKQQQVNVGFWSPWTKQLPLQQGRKDVHCLRFLSLSCICHSFCLDMSLNNKETFMHRDKTNRVMLLLFMLNFRQNVWTNEVGLQKEQTLKILFWPPSNSSSLTSPSAHLSLSCLTYKSDRRWTAS